MLQNQELSDINNGERVYLSEMMPSDNKAEDIYEKLFAFIKDHIVSLYKQTISNVTMIVPPYFQSVDPRKKLCERLGCIMAYTI